MGFARASSTGAADLSNLAEIACLANAIIDEHDRLDVLINSAGVYGASETITGDGLDVRFAVNTIAPWLLTRQLLLLMDASARVVNLSSAAHAPVDPKALSGEKRLEDNAPYAQSKLAITAEPHPDALDARKSDDVVRLVESMILTLALSLAPLPPLGSGAIVCRPRSGSVPPLERALGSFGCTEQLPRQIGVKLT